MAAIALAAAALVAACAGPAPSPSPTPVPTPVVTPDPHLPDPATVQQVYDGLAEAGLAITPNTATAGPPGGDVVTRIFGTYLGWPIEITEFRSSAALARAVTWADGDAPGNGHPPISLAGSNILLEWGPTVSGTKPVKPTGPQADGLEPLVEAFERLLAPLRARANVALSRSAPIASAPTSPAASPATEPEPEATPSP